MAKRIHIIIVEPSAIIRSGMATLLQRAEKLNIDVAELSSLSSVSAYDEPDILIISPSQMGTMTLPQIRGQVGNENLKVVALQSSFADHNSVVNFDEVLSLYDTFEAIEKKIAGVLATGEEVDDRKELSAREKEIIVCVVKGMINKQIADELNISTHTVITHRKNIANKLKIHSPAGLTIYAIVNKLVDLSEIQ